MKNIAQMTLQEQENLRVMLIDLANDHRAVNQMIADGHHLNANGRYQFAKQYRIEAGIWDDAFCDQVGEWWSHELVDLYATMTLLQFGAGMLVDAENESAAEEVAKNRIANNPEKYELVDPQRQPA